MTEQEAADLLAQRYADAPKGEVPIQVILFAIQYASALTGHSLTRIAKLAHGVPNSYSVELAYGRKLARHVMLKSV